jgi:hypothetical protein
MSVWGEADGKASDEERDVISVGERKKGEKRVLTLGFVSLGI